LIVFAPDLMEENRRRERDLIENFFEKLRVSI
jgi:hypothetical protein